MSYSMSDLLQLVVAEGASDLHIRVGVPPTIRVHGILHRVEGPALKPEDSEELMRSITSEEHIQSTRERGGADFGFAFGDAARFRVAVFKEKGNFGIVLRQIPSKMLTMEQIGIPPSSKELLYKPRGLVLVTGPTGCGKTTTLASMINIINEEREEAHIITIEDPIEYYHKHKKALITQREIGVDVPNFAEGLRRALRMDPDVVLVGEMRDLETIDAAITAAETGHLVFGTLHTTGAAKTVDRIVNAFPNNQQEQIRIHAPGRGQTTSQCSIIIAFNVLNCVAVHHALHDAVHCIHSRDSSSLCDGANRLIQSLRNLMRPADKLLVLQERQGQHHSVIAYCPYNIER